MSHAGTFEGIRGFFAALSLPEVLVYVTPFTLILATIAIFPLWLPHFWEKNKNKAIVTLLLASPIAVFLILKDWPLLVHTLLDYGTFIALLASLFVISGGIYIRGSFAGFPWVNTAFLLIGGLLASFIGTTGASALLIRPLLRANVKRHHKVHLVIFFIFIVSNCSGILTPLGDPPLFLGFLKGIPFAWTLRLWPQWSFMVISLLLIFFLIDHYYFKKEPADVREGYFKGHHITSERFGIEGRRNFIWLLSILVIILFCGYVLYPMKGEPILGESFGSMVSRIFQIITMVCVTAVSFSLTPRRIHKENHFSFGPIVEVAILFSGIFISMVPALLILETQGSKLPVHETWHFFWLSGGLSSFLDNAPTYLTFASLAKGTMGFAGEGLRELITHARSALLLSAISCGSVFMGANTYIGNGPNFMVKAIAEHGHIKMPSFFGYMKWSLSVLIPLFILVTLIFFRTF